jgi:hypothetical protein
LASKLDIGLIFYGEDGEVEYGGTSETETNPIYNVEYMKKIYLEGGYEKVIGHAQDIPEADLNFFKFPTCEELERCPVSVTHWSYFENWDPYRNLLGGKRALWPSGG